MYGAKEVPYNPVVISRDIYYDKSSRMTVLIILETLFAQKFSMVLGRIILVTEGEIREVFVTFSKKTFLI